MCGIVGYVGTREAQPILLAGLKRLEYRGYDSAGIATISSSGALSRLRERGKVAALEALVAKQQNSDEIGIGHTRWATHGAPTTENAHPHTVGRISLVHNGIIENYQEIRSILEEKQYTFMSETDTEVLTALIDSLYQDGVSLREAVSGALRIVVGAYGIAVMAEDQPGTLIAARHGSPLIVGIGSGETFIASDASALIGHTDQVIYLKEGELAVCTAQGVNLYDATSIQISAVVETIQSDMQAIQKDGYDHFLLKEINEQPKTVASTLVGRINPEEGSVRLGGIRLSDDELRAIKHVMIVGCGTAYFAGTLAGYFIEQLTDDVTVSTEIASELRYRSFNVPEGTIALIVSQSGETADTLACLNELKRRGVRCLGVINAVGSTIAREVDGGVYVHVGPEISVASTKAFTSQVTAMVLFGLVVAQSKGAAPAIRAEYITELAALPEAIQSVIDSSTMQIKELAKKYSKHDHALYVGRDTLYPVALEGALKLKEISYIQAEGYAAGELKHGPIALVDDRFFEVALLSDNWLFDKSISNITEIQSRGGHIVTITDSQKPVPGESVLRLETSFRHLTPLLFNISLQLLAYYIAVERGDDVDQPRNLAKSVTVE